MNGAEPRGVVLETPRCRLRPHRVDDYEAVAALWGDPATARWIGGAPEGRDAAWTRLLKYMGHWQALGFGFWAVCERESGAYLGDVGLMDHQRVMTPDMGRAPEAGWAILPSAAGAGVATEAMGAALAWADRALAAPETFCIIAPENAASLRVAEKCGFLPAADGTLRDAAIRVLTRPKGGRVSRA